MHFHFPYPIHFSTSAPRERGLRRPRQVGRGHLKKRRVATFFFSSLVVVIRRNARLSLVIYLLSVRTFPSWMGIPSGKGKKRQRLSLLCLSSPVRPVRFFLLLRALFLCAQKKSSTRRTRVRESFTSACFSFYVFPCCLYLGRARFHCARGWLREFEILPRR